MIMCILIWAPVLFIENKDLHCLNSLAFEHLFCL